MQTLNSLLPDFDHRLKSFLSSRNDPAPNSETEARVREIISGVRHDGDAALVRFTEQLDRWSPRTAADLRVSAAEVAEACAEVGPQVIADLQLAADRIRQFHRRQRESNWQLETEEGILLGQRTVPLKAAGLYVPGGTAAYPSSVLMNAIPASVAGVEQLVMVTPTPDGVVNPVVLAAAHVAGIQHIYRVGGAQAVAALAYGTTLIPRVDKIVGPGNQWVATAKRQVFGQVAIDSIAGPSEICVVAEPDGGASAAELAADLLSQAEHDVRAMAVFITSSDTLLHEVKRQVSLQLETLPRSEIARQALGSYGLCVLTQSTDESVDIANRVAPEHLELVLQRPLHWAERITTAGAIFCGPHTPEAVGDYIAGPNHVLPTNGTARFFSPLGVYDFTKRLNIIRFSEAGLRQLGPATARLADLEGLKAHADSVRIRLGREE